MKKNRKQVWIDEKLWDRLAHLLNTNPNEPLLDYKSKTEFIERSINDKLDEKEDKLILKKIKNSDFRPLIEEGREFQKMKRRSEETSKRLSRKLDKILKKKKHTQL